MNEKILPIVRNLLIQQLNHWVLAPAAYLCIVIWGEMIETEYPFPYLFWALTGLILPVFWYLRSRFRNVGVMLFMHLLTLFTVPLVSTLAPSCVALYILTLIVYIIVSFTGWARSHKAEDTMVSAFLALLIWGITSAFLYLMGKYDVIEILVLWMIPVSGLFFICYFLMNLNRFAVFNKDSTQNLSQRRIIARSMGYVIMFVFCVMLAGLLLTRFEEVDYLSQFLFMAMKWIIWAFVFVISILPRLFNEEYEAPNLPEQYMQIGGGEDSLIAKVLGYLFTVAVIILIGWGFALSVRRFVRFLSERRQRKKTNDTDGAEDVREKCEIERKGRSLRELLNSFSEEEKIRRLYKKTVIANRKKINGITETTKELGFYTAHECAEKLNRERMGEIYDKARYSQETCSAEDVREMKKLSG